MYRGIARGNADREAYFAKWLNAPPPPLEDSREVLWAPARFNVNRKARVFEKARVEAAAAEDSGAAW